MRTLDRGGDQQQTGVKGWEKVGKGEMSVARLEMKLLQKDKRKSRTLERGEAVKRGKPMSWIEKAKEGRALPLHFIMLPTFLIFITEISS